MRIIRGTPATGKPPKIICTGCGKKAIEAGCAIHDTVFRRFVESSKTFMMIEEDDTQPLCEDCLTALERADQR